MPEIICVGVPIFDGYFPVTEVTKCGDLIKKFTAFHRAKGLGFHLMVELPNKSLELADPRLSFGAYPRNSTFSFRNNIV